MALGVAFSFLESVGNTFTSLPGRLFLVVLIWLMARITVKVGQDIVAQNKKFMRMLDRVGITERKFQALDVIFDICIYSLALMITLYIFNLTSVIYTVLTAAGVMGIVVGFAVKEIASNAISGLIIKINQPFRTGHYIAAGGVSGTVRKIRTYSTELVSSDGIRTILPNSKLVTTTVTNYSVEPERRIDIKVNVSPGTNVEKALDVLKKIGTDEKRRVEKKPAETFVNTIGDYFITLKLSFWTKRDDFWPTKQDTLLNIAEAFRKKRIKLAVPMRRTVTDEYR